MGFKPDEAAAALETSFNDERAALRRLLGGDPGADAEAADEAARLGRPDEAPPPRTPMRKPLDDSSRSSEAALDRASSLEDTYATSAAASTPTLASSALPSTSRARAEPKRRLRGLLGVWIAATHAAGRDVDNSLRGAGSASASRSRKRAQVESVARFPARPHALPDDDPYRVTLRKLWKKMVERDWRTTTKALYLLHALSRSTPTKNARALSRTLKSMVGDADPKTGRKYFSRRELVSLRGDDAGDRGAVVDAYAGFVLRRALLFAAKFDDVSPPKKKKGEEAPTCAADEIDGLALKRAQNALLVLEHALQFLRVALDDPDPRRQHLVVVSCVELVVADVVDAWGAARKAGWS